MYDIELRIKLKDWLYILIIGIVLGMLLSSLGYALLERPWLEGMYYGLLLGFLITLFSLAFITFMNQRILPHLSKAYWLPMAVVFSFLSGFLGTLLSTYFARVLEITLIPMFQSHTLQISVAIGILTYVVGALLYRFVRMRNEKEDVDHHYVQSRLRSLETQLNPHFLFNALNSIAELIHHDPIKAEEALLKVSSFLRNTMKEEALIPLKDELRNVKEYIELENIRFSGKIKLHIAVDVPRWKVPKFSIQLLVENAIKHGYTTHRDDLLIEISFLPEEKIISIKNNGTPIKNSTFGIGLNNLNQRLELLCSGRLEIKQTDIPKFYIHLGKRHENTDR
jgi:sensor histidine kinase YesM